MRHFLLLFLLSCQTPPVTYQDDFSFPTPFSQNSPEELIILNDLPCLDAAGLPGLCSLRVTQGKDLSMVIPPRPYSYQLSFSCSQSVQESKEFTVSSGERFQLLVPSSSYSDRRSFICIGAVHPQDRASAVSVSFEFRVKVIGPDYQSLEQPRVVPGGIQTGKYARHVLYREHGVWKHVERATFVTLSDPESWVFVESASGRRSYYFGVSRANRP